MSEKRAKRDRAKERLEYIRLYNKWLDEEPPMWRVRAWFRWKNSRPKPCK